MRLVEFLLARIADDEAAVNNGYEWIWENDAPVVAYDTGGPGADYGHAFDLTPGHPMHRDRVLADCATRRQLVRSVEIITGGDLSYRERMKMTDVEHSKYVITRDMLGWLALPYADHPDYNEAWRP